MADHVHRWICGDTSGGITPAFCDCGAERTFNSQGVWDFNNRLSAAMPDLITDRQKALLNGKTWRRYETYEMSDEVVS